MTPLPRLRKKNRAEKRTVHTYLRKNFVTLPVRATVSEALDYIRTSARQGDIFYLYVEDETKRLCGVVSIRSLLLADDDQKVENIVSRNMVCVAESTPLSEVYHQFAKSKFLSLPVVDARGQIAGVIHAHELAETHAEKPQDHLFEERNRGELFELLGVKAEDQKRGAFAVAWGRFPWLLINLAGGIFCALLIEKMGGRLGNAVQLLAFVPILLIIGESVGMQTASVTIANLNRGIRGHRGRKGAMKESLVAALLGFGCALVVAGASFAWTHSPTLALTIALTVFCGTCWVSALGTLIPYFIHRFNIDPRVASGPIILAISDGSILLLYLTLAFFLNK